MGVAAGEGGVRAHGDAHVEITGEASARAGTALAAGANPGAVVDPGRDLDLDPADAGRPFELDCPRGAPEGLLEADLRRRLDVVPAARRRSPPSAASLDAAEAPRPRPEELGEEIAEPLRIAEQVLKLVGRDRAVLVALPA